MFRCEFYVCTIAAKQGPQRNRRNHRNSSLDFHKALLDAGFGVKQINQPELAATGPAKPTRRTQIRPRVRPAAPAAPSLKRAVEEPTIDNASLREAAEGPSRPNPPPVLIAIEPPLLSRARLVSTPPHPGDKSTFAMVTSQQHVTSFHCNLIARNLKLF